MSIQTHARKITSHVEIDPVALDIIHAGFLHDICKGPKSGKLSEKWHLKSTLSFAESDIKLLEYKMKSMKNSDDIERAQATIAFKQSEIRRFRVRLMKLEEKKK